MGDRMVERPVLKGGMNTDGCVESTETPVGAAPAGVPAQPPAGWHVEVVRVEKRWNIGKGEIREKIAEFLKMYGDGFVTLYHHDTWGSCRETKWIVLNVDGSYLTEGEWVDRSSRKNVHKWKIAPEDEFLQKYAGRELLAFAFVSPSCNKAKQYSFKAVFKVVVDG